MAQSGRDLGSDYLHCSLYPSNRLGVALNGTQSDWRRDIWPLVGYSLDEHCGNHCSGGGIWLHPYRWARNNRSTTSRTLASYGCRNASGWVVLYVRHPAAANYSLWFSKFCGGFDFRSLSGLPFGNNSRYGSGSVAVCDAGKFGFTGDEDW